MKNETKMSAEKVVKQPKPKLMNIKLEKLHPFENHPYKVLDDDSMTELIESIKEYGFNEGFDFIDVDDDTIMSISMATSICIITKSPQASKIIEALETA